MKRHNSLDSNDQFFVQSIFSPCYISLTKLSDAGLLPISQMKAFYEITKPQNGGAGNQPQMLCSLTHDMLL